MRQGSDYGFRQDNHYRYSFETNEPAWGPPGGCLSEAYRQRAYREVHLNIKRAFRVWQRNFTVYTKLYKSSIALNFIEPILYLTAMGFGLGAFVQQINGVPYIKFIAPGIIASSSMFAAIYECTYGTYVRMTYQKTFDAILATPVNIDDLVAGGRPRGAPTKKNLAPKINTLFILFFSL